MLSYMQAVLRELDAWALAMGEEVREIDSIYMGGGTPSLLRGSEVAALLEEIDARFHVHDGTEITVEINPATWGREDFAHARAGGVNRLSVGVQSLSDRQLKLLGRAHDAEAARKAVRFAADCKGASVSLDILYGLPDMDVASLLDCLYEVLDMGPQHISLYALTLAEGTSMYKAVAAEEIGLPEEEETAEQFLAASGLLQEAGYEHYEISNFALPGHYSRHNMACWNREEYLGIGAGAHSFVGKCRFANTRSVLAYMRFLASGQLAVAGCEIIGEKEEVSEEIMLGLRTRRGVSDGILCAGKAYIDDLERAGMLKRENGYVRLTDAGMLVSNALIVELLPA